MEYQIVSKKNQYDLKKQINELIDDGWIPQGGLCLGRGELFDSCLPSSDIYWSQAMIKHEDD